VESGVLQTNVVEFLEGHPLTSKFNGYASCPLVTGYGKGIMPKFDYSMTPWETFLFLDQLKERRLFYFIKADLLPILYWRGLVR
uniref:Uncharacterized protein n=1 Tax=Romanomermis culicivorax TaxID=13658 RepID=A0A915JB54_ROMCU